MMTRRSAFLLQILEKFATPLMEAVMMVAMRQPQDDDGIRRNAEKMAELIGKSVQASIGLSQSFELTEEDGQADAIRLTLSAIAAPLIGHAYMVSGKTPSETEIKKLVTAMQAALTFAEKLGDGQGDGINAAPRLEAANVAALPADDAQLTIQYVHAIVPVVNAISVFSFGQMENRLVQDVAGRLSARAGQMCARLLDPSADGPSARQAELRVFKTLCDLYANCHREETARLLMMTPDAQARVAAELAGKDPLTAVWAAFDQRAAMLEAFGAEAVPGLPGVAAASSAGSSGGFQPAPQPVFQPAFQPSSPPSPEAPAPATQGGAPFAAFARTPADGAPVPAASPSAPPAAMPPPQDGMPAAVSAPASPMAFFKKREDGESASG